MGKSSSDTIQCPICGEMFHPIDAVFLDNGNVVCPKHAAEIAKQAEKQPE